MLYFVSAKQKQLLLQPYFRLPLIFTPEALMQPSLFLHQGQYLDTLLPVLNIACALFAPQKSRKKLHNADHFEGYAKIKGPIIFLWPPFRVLTHVSYLIIQISCHDYQVRSNYYNLSFCSCLEIEKALKTLIAGSSLIITRSSPSLEGETCTGFSQ